MGVVAGRLCLLLVATVGDDGSGVVDVSVMHRIDPLHTRDGPC